MLKIIVTAMELILLILTVIAWFELSNDISLYTGIILEKYDLDISYIKVVIKLSYGDKPKTSKCVLPVDSMAIDQLEIGQQVLFQAKSGRITGKLWHKKLIDPNFGRETEIN